jgi:alkyl sulfatase BDS1-like metallo-beta-lactamase superfamily hydrolase
MGMIRVMPLELILDAMTVRLNGERAAGAAVVVALHSAESGEHRTVWLEHAVLHHREGDAGLSPDLVVTAGHAQLVALLFGFTALDRAVADGDATIAGDPSRLEALLALLDRFDPNFAIVTP